MPIAPLQVQSSKTSENLLNEIHQVKNSLFQVKQTTKKKGIQQQTEFNKVIMQNGYKIYEL